MYRIRYYSEVYHPQRFSIGLLGLMIRVLNKLRWRLEVLVQRLVLKYMVREQNRPELVSEAESKLANEFWVDDDLDKLKARLPPSHPLVLESDADDKNTLANLATTQTVSMRDISGLISRMGNQTRARRYGKRATSSHVVIEDFEPVK